jgi:hypothetical protein
MDPQSGGSLLRPIIGDYGGIQISPIKKLAQETEILYKQWFHLNLLAVILTPMGVPPVSG